MRRALPVVAVAVLLAMSASADGDGVFMLDGDAVGAGTSVSLGAAQEPDSGGQDESLSSEDPEEAQDQAAAENAESTEPQDADEEENDENAEQDKPDSMEPAQPEEPDAEEERQEPDDEPPAPAEEPEPQEEPEPEPQAEEEPEPEEEDLSSYHKLERTEVPSYARKLRLLKASRSECKRECDQDDACEGFKYTSGDDKCELLAHEENTKTDQERAEEEVERQDASKETTAKMKARVARAAAHAGKANDELDNEKENLRLLIKKKDIAKNAAKTAERRDARVQDENRKATEVLKKELDLSQAAEDKSKDAYAEIRKERKTFDKAMKTQESHISDAKTHLREDMKERVDATMAAPLKEKREKLTKQLDGYRSQAEDLVEMEERRRDHMRNKADDLAAKIAALPSEPLPQALPNVTRFEHPKLTEEEQKEEDENNKFVKIAEKFATAKAIAKEKNLKFLAKETNSAAPPNRTEMVKEAVQKAQKRAIAGLANQKAEIKELYATANKWMYKASSAPVVHGNISSIIKNTTTVIENTEDIDQLHAAAKEANTLMMEAVEANDEANEVEGKNRVKADELKAKQVRVQEVNDARELWVDNRLVGFPDKEKAEFQPDIVKMSKQIENADPSSQRIEWLNNQVMQLYSKARREEYDQSMRDKLQEQLKLVEDDPEEMRDLAEQTRQTRLKRKLDRKMDNAGQEFDVQAKMANTVSSEKDAKKDFTTAEKGLEAKTFQVEAAELQHNKLNKEADKMKEKIKAMEKKLNKGTEKETVTTEVVDKDGRVIDKTVKEETVAKPEETKDTPDKMA